MEITRTVSEETLEMVVEGRLDGYWSDHLNAALAEAVREGHHRIRLDCSGLSFLSSAGIGVLMKFHRELSRINGSFRVVNPSAPISAVLRVTRLAAVLVDQGAAAVPVAAPETPVRRLEQDGLGIDIFELDARASLTCRTMGDALGLGSGDFKEADAISLESSTPTLALGVGAFGETFEECRPRFGELLSVAGATAYQPADGTNVADYLVASGPLGADVRVLYCLACEGAFSTLLRFESHAGATVGLSRLLRLCVSQTDGQSIGVVIVAEAAGLVGAALRRSPAEPIDGGDFFEHPGVRRRLTFTAEPAFPRSVVLVAGVVAPAASAPPGAAAQLRPIGPDVVGHLHAAAFRFHPVQKGRIDFAKTVAGLFDSDQLLGVLHLLTDDRGASGAGESELFRGACWIGPIPGGLPVS